MPDSEHLTEGARFAPSVPARHEAFPLKGCGALDWGMQSRLARIFRPDTRRTVMLAIDHGYFQGPTTGLERVDLSILPLLPWADALMTTRGMIRSTVPPASRVPIVLRASGGPSVLRELSDERLAVSMEDAARINAAAVAVQGSTLVQLSKHMSAAGGYYTFVSRGINPRAGFMTAWMYVFYSPLCAGPIYAYFGYLLQQELKAQYGINAPYLWWLCVIVGAPAVAYLAWRGLALSVKVLVFLGLAEMAIVLALAISGFISPGPGGDNLSSWNPGNSLSGAGFALAVVFSLQAMTGWEGAAPLAEETRNPRRNVPRATIISIIVLGVFLIFVYWGQIVGWGTSILTGSGSNTLVNSPDLPGLAIAHRVWGAGWVFVLAAMFTSTLAVCQATNNVSTRMWYKMGETGTLPKWFAKVHPTYRTPVNAIIANMMLSLAVGLIIGALLNPTRSYLLVDGLILVLAVLYIYVSANVAVALYYLRQRRDEFNWILHIALPVISTGALIYVTIKSFQPFPSFPYNYAPLIDGIWFAIGLGILGVLWWRKKDDWIARAGEATVDADEIKEIDPA